MNTTVLPSLASVAARSATAVVLTDQSCMSEMFPTAIATPSTTPVESSSYESGAGLTTAGPVSRSPRRAARELLVHTRLPLGDIAFAAGFGSVRQFNETVGAVYQQTPSELRLRGGRRSGAHSPAVQALGAPGEPGTSVSLRLPARAPFDGAGVLGFLGARAVAGVESFDGGVYRRAVRLPAGIATVAPYVDADSWAEVSDPHSPLRGDMGQLVAAQFQRQGIGASLLLASAR